MKLKRLIIPVALLLITVSNATWSIVAVDAKTKEVGIAGASCTDFVFGLDQAIYVDSRSLIDQA